MNIQDEMQNIHHKYGVSEKANYEIEKFVEKLIEDDRAEQLILHNVIETPIQWLKNNKEVKQNGSYFPLTITYVQCASWINEYVKKYYAR